MQQYNVYNHHCDDDRYLPRHHYYGQCASILCVVYMNCVFFSTWYFVIIYKNVDLVFSLSYFFFFFWLPHSQTISANCRKEKIENLNKFFYGLFIKCLEFELILCKIPKSEENKNKFLFLMDK